MIWHGDTVAQLVKSDGNVGVGAISVFDGVAEMFVFLRWLMSE